MAKRWKSMGAALVARRCRVAFGQALLGLGLLTAMGCASQASALPKDLTDKDLVGMLSGGDETQRKEACERLGKNRSTLAIAEVGKVASQDGSIKVRKACVEALEEMGGAESAQWLRKIALSDSSDEVREEALDGLAEIGDEQSAAPVAIELLQGNGSVQLRSEAADVIGDKKWRSGIPALAQVAKGEGPLELRRKALEELYEMGDPSAYAVVYDVLLNTQSVEMRREAAKLIAKSPQATAFDPLCRALKDSDEKVVEDAIKGLEKLGDPSAVPVLQSTARDAPPKLAERMNKAAEKLSKQ